MQDGWPAGVGESDVLEFDPASHVLNGVCCSIHRFGLFGKKLQQSFGRTAGAVEGFKYSDAMKDSGIVWDETTIGEYLMDPKGYIPKNRMAFVGLKKEEDVANVIAYLQEATAQ